MTTERMRRVTAVCVGVVVLVALCVAGLLGTGSVEARPLRPYAAAQAVDGGGCVAHYDSEIAWGAVVPVEVDIEVGMQPSGSPLESAPCWGPNCEVLADLPDFTATATWCGVYQDESGFTQVGVNFDLTFGGLGFSAQIGHGYERLYFDNQGNFVTSVGAE